MDLAARREYVIIALERTIFLPLLFAIHLGKR